jgi:hypothetical protein
LEIHHFGDFKRQREVHVVEIYRHTIRIQETDTDLFQILGTREGDLIREDGVAVMEKDPLGSALHQDLRQALNIIRGGLLFYRVEVIHCQEEVGITCCIDKGFGLEIVGGVHDIEWLLVTQVGTQTKIIGAIFQADHDESETEGDGTMRRTRRTWGWSGSIMSDRRSPGDWIVLDAEEESVLVSDGVELELYLLDKAFRRIISFWDLDGEEMRIALIVRGIQTEHRILLRSGEMVVPVGDLDGCDTGFDHILVGMSEAVEEVRRGLLGILTEARVNVEDVRSVVVRIHDRILAVDFCGFDVEHGGMGCCI